MGKRGSGSSLLDYLPCSNLHIVMLGLDSAGKTTALYRLKFDQYLNTVPTIGFNCEKVKVKSGQIKGVTFVVWDIGGQDKLRPLWRSYSRGTDGIVFVVDSVDEERMEEAKVELLRLIKQPDKAGTPILVYANKQDLPAAKDPNEVARILGLTELPDSQAWHVQPACAIIGEGLADGLEKLYEMIQNRKRMSRSSYSASRIKEKTFMTSTSSSRSVVETRR
jgi:ADP-ribosylation factor-like protein 4